MPCNIGWLPIKVLLWGAFVTMKFKVYTLQFPVYMFFIANHANVTCKGENCTIFTDEKISILRAIGRQLLTIFTFFTGVFENLVPEKWLADVMAFLAIEIVIHVNLPLNTKDATWFAHVEIIGVGIYHLGVLRHLIHVIEETMCGFAIRLKFAKAHPVCRRCVCDRRVVYIL